jgi:hypothetical protein
LRGGEVENTKIETGVENAPRHTLTHPAEADETYFHGSPWKTS